MMMDERYGYSVFSQADCCKAASENIKASIMKKAFVIDVHHDF